MQAQLTEIGGFLPIVKRALSVGLSCTALLLPAGADAGWSPAHDLPSSETFAPAASTAGRGTEVVGYLARGGGTLARFPSARLTAPSVLERRGYNESSGFSLATSPSGRAAAAWTWLDGTDDGAETRIECCERAVVATWDRGGHPHRQVLSQPGVDVRDVTVKMRADGRAVVAWQEVGSGAIRVGVETARGAFPVSRVDTPAEFKTHFQDVFLAVDRGGRLTVNWIEGGLGGGPVRLMAARSDTSGRFGPPQGLGSVPDVGINPYEVLTDDRGGQAIVWTTSSASEDDALFATTRGAGAPFGPPIELARDVAQADAAVGPRGDLMVVWTVGPRAFASRGRTGGAFGKPEGLPGDVRFPVAGIDGRSRTTVLYPSKGRIRARVAPPARRFGSPLTVSHHIGGRTACGGQQLDVAPNGDAIGLWGCGDRGFDNERVQAAVYRR